MWSHLFSKISVKTRKNNWSDSVGSDYELGWYGEPDTRSYRVDFTKLKEKLGFKIEHDVKEASKNVYNALNEGRTTKSEKTSVVSWLKHVSDENKLKLLDI